LWRSIGETRERIDDQLCRRRRRLDLAASVPARRGSVRKFAGCAIVTGDRAKAVRLAEVYGIGTVVGYDGYDALLDGPGIDAVYIALPNHMAC